MFWFMVLSTTIDTACFQMFRAISGTNADGCRWHDGGADVSMLNNIGTRNLFCYFFLRSDHILTVQTTKNQNMAGTKVQTSKVWKCPIFPDLARFSGETGSIHYSTSKQYSCVQGLCPCPCVTIPRGLTCLPNTGGSRRIMIFRVLF